MHARKSREYNGASRFKLTVVTQRCVILGPLFMDITYESVLLIMPLIVAASTLFQGFVSSACLLSCPRVVFRKRMHLGGHLYEAVVHVFGRVLLAFPALLLIS